MNIEEERKDFEEWFLTAYIFPGPVEMLKKGIYQKEIDGSYRDRIVENAWSAWKVRAALINASR